MKEKFCILIKISLKLVLKGPTDPALVQIMAWRRIRRQAIIWTIAADPIYWRIYAALGGNELNE